MATLRISTSTVIYPFRRNTASTAKNNSTVVVNRETKLHGNGRKKNELNVCVVLQQRRKNLETEKEMEINNSDAIKSYEAFNHVSQIKLSKSEERLAKKKFERTTYLLAATLSSLGIPSMAIMAVYCRFSWQMEDGEFQLLEMFGTFALSVGAAVGMEYWARWAHGALWHASLWHMHESHHRAREGAFELNDVFAVANAVPAIALLSYGFFNGGFVPGLCFGAIHHADKFDRVPYGLFLGPQELEEVGGLEELEKEIKRKTKFSQNSDIL